MSLQNEIDKMVKEIRTDQYSMSIGELVNIYNADELDIHPEFQRIFRWDLNQRSNLIESILLKIPIPPIFVSQNEKGVWDVIDGQQRLSTIFEFMGILKDENNVMLPPSVMTKTKFLPSLEDKYWECEEEDKSLTEVQRRSFKREKINITIIDKSSDKNAKYELFQRLNTGGSRLSPQEIRNCLLVMINKPFYEKMREMNEEAHFKGCLPLPEGVLEEQGDMELIVRYIIARNCNFDKINKDANIHAYLTEEIVRLAQDDQYDMDADIVAFRKTFQLFFEMFEENAFKRYNPTKDKFEGPVLVSGFEAIVLGVSQNIDKILVKERQDVEAMIKGLYNSSAYIKNTARGVRPINRFKALSFLSMETFGNED